MLFFFYFLPSWATGEGWYFQHLWFNPECVRYTPVHISLNHECVSVLFYFLLVEKKGETLPLVFFVFFVNYELISFCICKFFFIQYIWGNLQIAFIMYPSTKNEVVSMLPNVWPKATKLRIEIKPSTAINQVALDLNTWQPLIFGLLFMTKNTLPSPKKIILGPFGKSIALLRI